MIDSGTGMVVVDKEGNVTSKSFSPQVVANLRGTYDVINTSKKGLSYYRAMSGIAAEMFETPAILDQIRKGIANDTWANMPPEEKAKTKYTDVLRNVPGGKN